MVYINDFNLKGLECIEGCILLLCDYFRKEYEASYYNVFSFCFNQNSFNKKGRLGDCLYPSFSIKKNVSQIYGLKIKRKKYVKHKALLNIEESLKANIPVLILSSTQYCPWINKNNLINKSRYLLVYDMNHDFMKVIDPVLDRQRKKLLLIRDLPQGRLQISKAKLGKYCVDYQEIKDKMVFHLKTSDNQKSFEDCANVIQRLKILDSEFNTQNDHTWNNNSDIYFGRRLPNSCLFFIQFLKYLEKNLFHCELFQREYLVLEDIRKDWMLFRNLLFRYKLSNIFGQEQKDKLIQLLDKIGVQYQQIVRSILEKTEN